MTALPQPEVAVDVLAPVAVDTAYSYRAPSDWKLEPGACVRVPLGARLADRRRLGGASGRRRQPQVRRRRPRLAAAPAALRDFIDWVARWTLSPRGMVLADGDPRRRARPSRRGRNSASSRPASRRRG